MSVNIVNKTTGELTKVAGNVAPPTDSVTDGDMRPVTSNAVYDYLNERVSVTKGVSETISSALDRLYDLIDTDKVTQRTVLSLGTGAYYRLVSKSSSVITFGLTLADYSSGDVHIYENKIALINSGSYYKQVDISTGAGSGSGTSLRWTISDISSSTTIGTSITLIY